MTDKELVPLFIPALGAILISAEDKKGSPLSEQKVIKTRDSSTVIMVSQEHAVKIAESRGYADIDPENCWYDWQMLRRKLDRKPDIDPGARFSYVNSTDDEFQKIAATARNTLSIFRDLLSKSAAKGISPLVKTLLSEPNYKAYMWLIVTANKTNSFEGEIFELPSEFKEFRVGQNIDVLDDEVQDWMINDSGTLYGGYSLRYSRSKMNETDKEAFDQYMGVKKYA